MGGRGRRRELFDSEAWNSLLQAAQVGLLGWATHALPPPHTPVPEAGFPVSSCEEDGYVIRALEMFFICTFRVSG